MQEVSYLDRELNKYKRKYDEVEEIDEERKHHLRERKRKIAGGISEILNMQNEMKKSEEEIIL